MLPKKENQKTNGQNGKRPLINGHFTNCVFTRFNGRRDYAYMTTDNVLIYHNGVRWTQSQGTYPDLSQYNIFYLAQGATSGLFAKINNVSNEEKRNIKIHKKMARQGIAKARSDKFATMQAGEDSYNLFYKIFGNIGVDVNTPGINSMWSDLKDMLSGISEKVSSYVSDDNYKPRSFNNVKLCVEILLLIFKAWSSNFSPSVILADITVLFMHHGFSLGKQVYETFKERLTPCLSALCAVFQKGGNYIKKLFGKAKQEPIPEPEQSATFEASIEEIITPVLEEREEKQYADSMYEKFKQYVPEDSQSLIENIVQALTLIFGVTLLAVVPGKNDFLGISKKVVALASLWKNGGTLLELFKTVYTCISDWCVQKLLGIDMSAKRIGAIVEGAEEIIVEIKDLLIYPDIKEQVRIDPDLSERVTSAYMRSMTLYSTLLRRTGVPASIGVLLRDLIGKLEPIYANIDLSGKFNKANRIEPLVVKFFGTSGVGKSALTYPLVVDVLSRALEGMKGDVRDQIYNRNVAQEFWDGYTGQFAVVYDDFGQLRDSESKPNLEFMEIIRMQNLATFDLHMAHLENKGKSTFSSKLVVCSSNALMHNIKSLIEPSAVNRRFDYVIGVEPAEQFAKEVKTNAGTKQMRMDADKVREHVNQEIAAGLRKPCELVCLEAYVFKRYNPDTGHPVDWIVEKNNKRYTTPTINYDQLRTVLVNGLKEKERKCGALREQLKVIAERSVKVEEVKTGMSDDKIEIEEAVVSTDEKVFQSYVAQKKGHALNPAQLEEHVVTVSRGDTKAFYCYPYSRRLAQEIYLTYQATKADGTCDALGNYKYHLTPLSADSPNPIIHNIECGECFVTPDVGDNVSFTTAKGTMQAGEEEKPRSAEDMQQARKNDGWVVPFLGKNKTKERSEKLDAIRKRINDMREARKNDGWVVPAPPMKGKEKEDLDEEAREEQLLIVDEELAKYLIKTDFRKPLEHHESPTLWTQGTIVKSKLSPTLNFAKCFEQVLFRSTRDEWFRGRTQQFIRELVFCDGYLRQTTFNSLAGPNEKKEAINAIANTFFCYGTQTDAQYRMIIPGLTGLGAIDYAVLNSLGTYLELLKFQNSYDGNEQSPAEDYEELKSEALESLAAVLRDFDIPLLILDSTLVIKPPEYFTIPFIKYLVYKEQATKFKEQMEKHPLTLMDKIMSVVFTFLSFMLLGFAVQGAIFTGIYIFSIPIKIFNWCCKSKPLRNIWKKKTLEEKVDLTKNLKDEHLMEALEDLTEEEIKILHEQGGRGFAHLTIEERADIIRRLNKNTPFDKQKQGFFSWLKQAMKPESQYSNNPTIEGRIDAQQCNIINCVSRNICKLTFTSSDFRYYINAVAVCGQTFLTNRHLLPYLTTSEEMEIKFLEARNGELKVNFKTHNSAGQRVINYAIVKDEEGRDTDAVLLTVPGSLASFPSIVKHFVDRKFHARVPTRSGTLIVPRYTRKDADNKWDRTSPITLERDHTDITYVGSKTLTMNSAGSKKYSQTLSRFYQHYADTDGGDCGSLLLVRDVTEQRKICALHAASMDTDAANVAQALCREDIEDALAKLPKTATTQLDMDEIAEPLDSGELEMPMGQFIPYGVHKEVYSGGMKTSLKQTKIAGKVWDVNKKPAFLKPTEINGQMIDILPHNLKKCGMPSIHLDELDVQEAGDNYSKVLMKNAKQQYKRILTDEEAISGIEGDIYFQGINRKSSAGFGWSKRTDGQPGKRKWLGEGDEWVIDNAEVISELRLREEKALKNERVPTIFVDTLKDEKRPIEKVNQGKTRAFSAGPMGFTIAFRKYFGGFIANHMSNRIANESAVGINAFGPEWNVLAHKLTSKGEKVIAGDYSNFDGTLCRQILMECLRLINKWYNGTEEEEQIRNVLFQEISSSVHICRNIVYGWTHSLPSGNPATAILNSMYNSISMRMVYKYCLTDALNSGIIPKDRCDLLRQFNQQVTMIAYGDDNVINMSDEVADAFNQQTISENYKVLGMTYTDEAKSDGFVPKWRQLNQVSFLKREFRYDEETAMYMAPLELDSTLGMLNFFRKGTFGEVYCVTQIIDSALQNLFAHGRSAYNKWSKIIETEFYSVYSPRHESEVPTFPSYESMLQNYMYGKIEFFQQDLSGESLDQENVGI